LEAPAPRITESVFDSGLVHIDPVAGRDVTQLAFELGSLLGIALGVEKTLFLRVQPMRRSARENVIRLHLWPVSLSHATDI
jgi:hypothetical protein